MIAQENNDLIVYFNQQGWSLIWCVWY